MSIPISCFLLIVSFRTIKLSSATQIGLVVTRNVLFATEMYSRETIHVIKWTAKKMPDSALLNIVLASQRRMPLMMDLEEIRPRHIDAIASRRKAMVFEVAPSF